MQPYKARDGRATVMIADDHRLVAAGLASLVESEFDVIATADNGEGLLQAAASCAADIALLDISMPDMTGLDAARKLLTLRPQCKVIFVSMHSKPDFVREAFTAGAKGYVLKRSAASELIDAMREVLKGNAYISVEIARDVLSAFLLPRATPLTARQKEVLRLIAAGQSGKDIAKSLNISVKTAQFHKTSIMEKLALHSTAELTKYAIDHGIVS